MRRQRSRAESSVSDSERMGKIMQRNTYELPKIILYDICQNRDCSQCYPVVMIVFI